MQTWEIQRKEKSVPYAGKHCTTDQRGTDTCVFILVRVSSCFLCLVLCIDFFVTMQVRSPTPVASVAAGSGQTTTNLVTRKSVRTVTRAPFFSQPLSLPTVPVSCLTWSTDRHVSLPVPRGHPAYLFNTASCKVSNNIVLNSNIFVSKSKAFP